MEVLSLLKYWRGSAGGYQTLAAGNGIRPSFPVTTISASITPPAEEESSDDDGPFFDLEFAVPAEEVSTRQENDDRNALGGEPSDDERDFDLALTAETTMSTDLQADESSGSKSQMLSVSLLRAKVRVLMLGLRKQKSHAVDPHPSSAPDTLSPTEHQSQRHGKVSAVKIKVEEVPIASLFTRDNSSRNSGLNSKPTKQQTDDCAEKKLSKELVQKYLGKIKPLYVRGSKRRGEKSKSNSEQILPEEEEDGSSPSVDEFCSRPSSPKMVQRQNHSGAIPAGLRVVRKHLGKSRSASATVAAAPLPPPAAPKRRDDSLLQLQDGIQSAIAHCKMSLSVSRDSEASTDNGETAREDST